MKINTFSLIKTAAEPNRLRILSLLTRRDLCSCELVGILRISQPLVSAHLRVLKNVGLVKDRKEGRWVYFSLNREGWLSEKSWLVPLIKRIEDSALLNKDRSLLAECLCDRVNGKCINRFQPSR